MKHLNSLLLGAAALTLAGCANEDLVSNTGNGDGTATVVLNLDLPQIQSRSYSDGTSANDLHYAVYVVDENGNPKSYLEGHTHNDDGSSAYGVETINLKKQLTFKLVTGRKYGFVFWADNENAPYNVTFNEQGATMSVDYSNPIPANNETLDAFYAYETLDVNGDTQMDVKLYRPFAQINVGANDYEDAKKSNYVPTESYMSVKNVYTNLSLLSGGVDTPQDITFAYAPIPEDETFPVDGYDYLAMAYVLVDKEQALTTVAFDTQDEGKEKAAVRTVSSVPVKRNHRTNIYGQLFTNNVDIFIEIVPAYDEPDYPENALSQFQIQAQLGGLVTLEDDITLPSPIEITNGTTIDLNGHTITASSSDAFQVKDGANLHIKGDGKIVTTEDDYNPFRVYDGTLIIDNGEFISEVQCESVLVIKGKAIINGGKFSSQPWTNGINYTLNCQDAAYRDGSASIIVYGGTFYNFNPADSKADTKDGQNANFVAPGYQSVKAIYPSTSGNKECYVVIAGDSQYTGTVIAVDSTNSQYIKNAGTIIFLEDVFYDGGLTLSRETTWDLNGNSISSPGYGNNNDNVMVMNGGKVTIKNANIGMAENGTAEAGSASVSVVNSSAASLTLDNCNITGSHPVVMMSKNNDSRIIINSGTYYSETGQEAVYVYSSSFTQAMGKVEIYGGTFGQPGVQNKYLLNMKDVLVPADGSVDPRKYIEVYGGTFINFDPSNSYADPKQPGNLVADGYKVVAEKKGADTYYTVVKK